MDVLSQCQFNLVNFAHFLDLVTNHVGHNNTFIMLTIIITTVIIIDKNMRVCSNNRVVLSILLTLKD